MDNYLPMPVHAEYAKRMEEEHKRQNKRIDALEVKVTEIGELTVSVASLAQSVEQMVKEQKEQGERLKTLEARDGETWRKVTGYALTALISALVGFILSNIGL